MQNKQYYENSDIWIKGKYQSGEDQLRIIETLNMLPKNAKSLLDVGAGNGEFLKKIEENLNIKTYGLEISKTAIKNSVCKTELINQSLLDVEFDNDSFDVISCLEVIEHLRYEEYSQALERLIKYSNKYILISVPYKEERTNIICPYCSCEFNPWYHLRNFDIEKLNSLHPKINLIDYKLISKTKKIRFYKFFKKLGLINMKSFSHKHLCPQCGFKKEKSKRIKNSTPSLNFLKSIFYYEQPRWVICLYEKK